MDKLFHVFVSSTYSDLQEERRRVSEASSKTGHVPEGMEIFPASSQKQIDFIKRVIDRCDYYVIVLAGRYGSTTPADISFTELEYDYAILKKLPTLAFLHAKPGEIDAAKTDKDAAKAEKLAAFRLKVEANSLVDYWTGPDQLATKVVAAIAQEVATNPGIGWIRGNRAASDDLLNEINELRKNNEQLRNAIAATKPIVTVPNLAALNDTFTIHYKYSPGYQYSERPAELKLPWIEILAIIGRDYRTPSNTTGVENAIKQYLRDVAKLSFSTISLSMTDKERVLNQMELLGFMKSVVYSLQNGGQALFYELTPRGIAEVVRLNAVTASNSP